MNMTTSGETNLGAKEVYGLLQPYKQMKGSQGHFSLELLRQHIIWSAFNLHHIVFKVLLLNTSIYNSLFLTIIKEMQETKDFETEFS